VTDTRSAIQTKINSRSSMPLGSLASGKEGWGRERGTGIDELISKKERKKKSSFGSGRKLDVKNAVGITDSAHP